MNDNFKSMIPYSPFKRTRVRRKGLKKLCAPRTSFVLTEHAIERCIENDTLSWTVPHRLESPNRSINPYTKANKNKALRKKLLTYLPREFESIPLPCEVTLTRIAPRAFDDDNNCFSFKFVRDTLSDFFIPGLAPGRADGDKRLTWKYAQEKRGKGEYGIHIKLNYGQRPA